MVLEPLWAAVGKDVLPAFAVVADEVTDAPPATPNGEGVAEDNEANIPPNPIVSFLLSDETFTFCAGAGLDLLCSVSLVFPVTPNRGLGPTEDMGGNAELVSCESLLVDPDSAVLPIPESGSGADAAIGGPEGHEVLAEQAHLDGRAVRHQPRRQHRGQPVQLPEHAAHRRAVLHAG